MEVNQDIYRDAIQRIAQAIEGLKDEYPQLVDFAASKDCVVERLTIGYQYHIHQPEGRAGWAGAVPNPDEDGIWLHIDFHNPDPISQIHTQPFVMPLRFQDLSVMFLILEGSETKSVSQEMDAILRDIGVVAG